MSSGWATRRPSGATLPVDPWAAVARVYGDLPTLETPRLILRRFRLQDAADVFAYACDPEVARLTTWEAHTTLEDSRRFVEWVVGQHEQGQVAPWAVVTRDDPRVIGTCGYGWWNPRHASAELAYAIGRPYWNRGLTTEACREVVRFGFEIMGLNRIEIRCHPDNLASERVMQKVGASFEGILRQQMFVKGQYDDLKLYALLRNDHEAQQRTSASQMAGTG